MRRRAVAAALLAVGLLSGCSQIDALAPVSGGPQATVQVGLNDLLVSRGVQLLVVPTCVNDGSNFVCNGSTIDGEPVTAISTNTKPYVMSVTVGDETIYDGSVQDILDQAARGEL